MLEIHELNQNGLDIVELVHTDTHSTIQILPSAGALWHAWIIRNKGEELNLIDQFANQEELRKDLRVSHKSANLSPFSGRIPEGKYVYEEHQYEFKNKFSDGSAIHGLLVDKPFIREKTKQNPDEIAASFSYDYNHEDEGYPFDFSNKVTYHLDKTGRVTIETAVTNHSNQKIPLVDGWHPYFTTGSKVDQLTLRIAADQIIELSDQLVPTGKFYPYSEFQEPKKLEGIQLDHSLILSKNANQPKCTLTDPQKGIQINLFPSESYPYMQVYTPPHRNSIAIEPISGAPNAFNNGIGLILLAPEETRLFSVSFNVIFS